jgi:hypothetical protein
MYVSEKECHREAYPCFYFGVGSISRLLCWGVPNVPEKIGDGLILNRNKNYDTPLHLINTKHE